MEEKEKIVKCDSCQKKIADWDAFSLNGNDTLCFDCFHEKKPKDASSSEKNNSIYSTQHEHFFLKLKNYEKTGLLIISLGMIFIGLLLFNYVIDTYFDQVLGFHNNPEWFNHISSSFIMPLIMAIVLITGGILIIYFKKIFRSSRKSSNVVK